MPEKVKVFAQNIKFNVVEAPSPKLLSVVIGLEITFALIYDINLMRRWQLI
jgi:hypothetical protein